MIVSHYHWSAATGWSGDTERPIRPGLVLYFGTRQHLEDGRVHEAVRSRFGDAHVLGCSTGGQVEAEGVTDDRVSVLGLQFRSTGLRVARTHVADPAHSADAGRDIGQQLAAPDLAGIFVLSDGLKVNGSTLVDGIAEGAGKAVPVSGGLAGDGAAFGETVVGCDGRPESGVVAAIGFYGDSIRLGHGSAGGWDVFGPKRNITKSQGNVLHEIDGHPALDLYLRYLGPDDAQKLPGSALLFPMRIFHPKHPDQSVVRTVLAVDAETSTMTFAGDMPQGWTAQLMRGSLTRLCAGAADATRKAVAELGTESEGDTAAIMISCIGRRLLMGQRVDEEIEAAYAELPHGCHATGFYSYGEISPDENCGPCQVHNQTMTVTMLGEKAA